MSIATAIENAQQRVANCYTSVDNMGGTLPATQNLSNLPAAIESIPSGGDTVTIPNSGTTAEQKVLISFNSLSTPFLVDDYNKYIYTAVSNGDDTFRTALSTTAPYMENFTVQGSLTMSQDLVTTGWSTANYIDTNVEYLGDDGIEVLCKAYWDTASSLCPITTFCGMTSGKGLSGWNGSSWSTSSFYYNNNQSMGYGTDTNIWVRCRVIKGISMGWYIVDNNYTEDTLPSLDDYNLWRPCYIINCSESNRVYIGRATSSNNKWIDNIDLDHCKVYTLDTTNHTKTLAWQMYKPFSKTEQDTTHMIPSGDWDLRNGTSNAVSTTALWNSYGSLNGFTTQCHPAAKTFRWNLATAKSIYCKAHIKTAASASTSIHEPVIAYATNTYSVPLEIHISSSSPHAINGFGGEIFASTSTNTEYWFEVELQADGTRTVKTSLDGETWTTTTGTVTAPTWSNYSDVPTIGYWGNANFCFRGSIYNVEAGYVDANDVTHTFKLWK